MLKLPTVQLSRRDAKALIGERIKEGRRSSIEFYEASSKPAERRYATWDRRNYTFLAELFDTDEIAAEYKTVAKFNLTGTYKSPERAKQHQKRIDRKVQWFKELERRIDHHFHEAGESPPVRSFSEKLSALEKVDLLCSRFHAVVDQLGQPKRGNKRGQRSSVTNEYDIQDVFHALLWVFFKDVRREDAVPQRAGASSRTDFVLKQEQIIIELKKTRQNLKDKEVGDQLLIDIGRYKARKDCKLLYCFVYDPEGYIRNPTALEEELSSNDGELAVKVVVLPRR